MLKLKHGREDNREKNKDADEQKRFDCYSELYHFAPLSSPTVV